MTGDTTGPRPSPPHRPGPVTSTAIARVPAEGLGKQDPPCHGDVLLEIANEEGL